MKSKLIVTEFKNKIFTMITDGKNLVEINCYGHEQSIINNIYIAKVGDVVKYLDAAFVDYAPGKRGYYPFDKRIKPIFINPKNNDKVCQGDEVLLQVHKEGIKTKDPVLTSNINIAEKHTVLTVGKCFVGFSNKIKNESWKKSIKPLITEKCNEEYGFIIRTNAASLSPTELLEEIDHAIGRWEEIKNTAMHRTCYSIVSQEEAGYILDIKNGYNHELDQIITDHPDIYNEIHNFLEKEQAYDLNKLIFYEDQLLPLYKLYNLEKSLDVATNSRVWLKSGGYLIIEPTEALTVIDVNTGRYQTKQKDKRAFLKINKEAAIETARQLRIRNISGIIIVDFINMENEEDKDELIKLFSEELAKDPIKASLIDLTKLGLIEVTRRKGKKSLKEQLT